MPEDRRMDLTKKIKDISEEKRRELLDKIDPKERTESNPQFMYTSLKNFKDMTDQEVDDLNKILDDEFDQIRQDREHLRTYIF